MGDLYVGGGVVDKSEAGESGGFHDRRVVGERRTVGQFVGVAQFGGENLRGVDGAQRGTLFSARTSVGNAAY